MNRRHFIHVSGSALLGTALAPALSAAPAEPFPLGFSLYGMKSLDLHRALEICAGIGYSNVELTLFPGYPTAPARLNAAARRSLRTKLSSLDLTVSGLMLDLALIASPAEHARQLEAIRAAAQLAHDLEPGQPPVLETIMHGHPADWEGAKERMAAALKDWGETAARSGVSLALKGHTGQAVNTPQRLLWLLQQVRNPALCVVYDYSHFEMEGLALEPTLRALLPHTRYVHAKDARRQAGQVEFLLPGEGDVDYGAYFKLLHRLGYRGPVVAEVSTQIFSRPHYDPVLAARSSFAVLSAAQKNG